MLVWVLLSCLIFLRIVLVCFGLFLVCVCVCAHVSVCV